MTPEIALHAWRVPEREFERQEARRGRRFAYERIDPRRTALVVVDMVRFFVDGSPYARGIIPTINAVAEGLRSADGTVAWVVPKYDDPSPWETGFYGGRVAATYAASGSAVELPDRLAPQLAVAPVDLLVEKSSASALFPGRSALPELLASKEITTVVVAGTVTSVCCESTARDASTLGYQVIFLGDATADVSDDAHNAALRTIYRSFGDVRPSNDVLALLAADHRFAKSIPRIKLFETGATFISRSEAKQLALGLENFDEVELDFAGVTEVGQGFADELLRVWASQHPTTTLSPINMSDPVAFMIERARQT